MGLDAVELIMQVEETFDIKIRDDQVGGLFTLGDLYFTIVGERGIAARSIVSHAIPTDPNRLGRRSSR